MANYDVFPQAMTGKGIYGMVPGLTSLPNVYGDVASVYPGFPQANEAAANAVFSKLKGELSPATIAGIQDAAARFGVRSGMPGSGLAANRGLRDLGLNTEAVIQQGIQDYMGLLPTIAKNLTVSPETQIGLSQNNAVLRSAPDPTQAGTYAENLFKNYLASMRNSGAGPAGGTGTYAGRAPTSSVVPTGTSGVDPYDNMARYVDPNAVPSYYPEQQFQYPFTNESAGYNPGYDYAAGLWPTEPYPTGGYETPFQGTGEGNYIAPQEEYPSWDNYEMLFDY